MTINEFLLSLKSSGEGSFEDFVGELLGALTGLTFYAARSGDQGGRDGRAAGTSGGDIVFECKRYSSDTPFKRRELLGELLEAHDHLPDLDVWIFAASRDITDQNLESLEAYGKKHGIDILPLESVSDGSGSLDSLVGAFPNVVKRFATADQLADLATAIDEVAKKPETESRLAELRRQLLSPDTGWPAWRESSHREWKRVVSKEAASRSRFGQPLDVSSGDSVPRIAAESALDTWWENSPSKLFAMTGEEGDGKSWSVAQWLTNQIEKSKGNIPPIVFVPSRDAGSAKSLEDLVIENVNRLLPNADWKGKLHRWLEHRQTDGKDPVAVIVLDGLNERCTPEYWRDIIESSFDEPWVGKVRLICTARSAYWDEHFAKLPSIPSTRFKLESFSDEELKLALKRRGLDISEFPDELRSVLRKPRYFDLATKYREQLAEAGDFTLARLYFEDWRDRCDRSNRHMSVDAFNDFLRQIAEKRREGVEKLGNSEIEDSISLDTDSREAFRELTTGGVLVRDGARWKVSEARLPMALGLLLGDELTSAPAGTDLKELIAKWLEPHTGADFVAFIIEYAVLALIAQDGPSETVAILLQAWIDTQNPRSRAGDPIERRLTAYMPRSLAAYVELASSVWSGDKEHPWAQELLIRGFCFWVQNSETVAEGMMPVVGEWLSMVALDGPPMFRGKPFIGPPPKTDGKVLALWPDAQPNQDCDFDGYALRVIDDDGWLRLSHVAFVIISFMQDRRTIVAALVRYIIAKAIHESADGQNEFRWAIRSSKFDLYPFFEPHIQLLMADSRRPAQWATSRLLRAIGTEQTWRSLAAIDEDALYPTSDFEEECRKNPVESIFQCTTKDLEDYVARDDFKPWRFIDSAKAVAADTDMNLPPEVRQRLEPILGQLDVKPLWQGMWASGEDHFFEKAEIVLARVDPKAIAEVIRRICKSGCSRKLDALYSMAHRLEEYDLLFDTDTRTALECTRLSSPEIQGAGDSMGMHCEYFLFSRTLPLWTGSGQLERLLARQPDALDWIDFEHSYKGPVEGNLPDAETTRDWFRTLYYLSILEEDKLSDEALRKAYENTDSVGRGALYRYLFYSNVARERYAPFISEWSWKLDMHHMEQTFGSLLLMKFAEGDPSSYAWKRVDPTFRATAILKCGGRKQDWAEYVAWFFKTTAALQVPLPEGDMPAVEITCTAQEDGRPGRIALAPRPANSVRFVAPESHWGGRYSENPFAGLTEEPEAIRERTKAQYEQLRELNDKAAQNGNYWLQRCFPRDAIEAMLLHAPEVIKGSLRSVIDQSTSKVSPTAVSYYSALTEVLFSKPNRVGDAIRLHQKLRSLGYGIRIIDGDTRLNFLDMKVFAAPEAPESLTFWEEELAACSSDLDLLEVAIKVRRSPQGDSEKWLNGRINRDLESGTGLEQARAIILRGFLEPAPGTKWLTDPTEDDDTWYRNVLRVAQKRTKSERDTRHWFRKFCSSTDLDEAWGAFRLFLTIVDRRFWLWCYDEFVVLGENDPRRRFFESNRDEIKKACKNNEEKLSKSFAGCDVVDQMSPWKN